MIRGRISIEGPFVAFPPVRQKGAFPARHLCGARAIAGVRRVLRARGRGHADRFRWQPLLCGHLYPRRGTACPPRGVSGRSAHGRAHKRRQLHLWLRPLQHLRSGRTGGCGCLASVLPRLARSAANARPDPQRHTRSEIIFRARAASHAPLFLLTSGAIRTLAPTINCLVTNASYDPPAPRRWRHWIQIPAESRATARPRCAPRR